MKKKCFVIAALAFAGAASAQDSGFSAGLEVGLPIGDFGDVFSVGFGPSLGYDKEAGEKGLLGVDLSYLFHGGENSTITKAKTLNIIGHYKYFFDETRVGLYVAPLIGYSLVGYHIEFEVPGVLSYSGDESTGGLSFGLGAGYMVAEQIEVGASYRIIRATEDGDATASSGEASSSLGMLGFRAAYLF